MSKIVLTGGGTAGHVTPNLALLPHLKKFFNEIHYIGSINGIEKEILSQYPEIIFHEIPTVKLIRSLNLKNLFTDVDSPLITPFTNFFTLLLSSSKVPLLTI